jgi:ABC-type phosphate transport system substrate-binding protein
MRDGKMDLAIVAAPSGQALPIPPGYEKMDFCFQVAYIVVNPDNPITEIDRDDLVGVFGAGEETDISRWEQLGLAGSWSLRAVLPVSSNSNEGVVLELFKYTILGQIQLKPTVMVLNSSADVDKYIGDNPNAIAITRYVPDTEGKALLVSIGNSAASSTPGVGDTGATSVSFEPSPENVYDGDYPLRLPFYVVYKTSEKVQLRELLRVLYSDDFTSSLSDNHFMPVPDTVRKRNLLELDSAK